MSSQTEKKQSPSLQKSNLTPEQSSAIDYAYENDHSLLMLPVGFGKTVVSLTAANELLADGVVKRILIVAPLRVCQLTWKHEYRKWEHLLGLDIDFALGTEKTRAEVMESDAKIVVINFENLAWAMKTFKHLFSGKGGPGEFDGLIVDELTKLKTVGGVGFKALRPKLKNFKWRMGMTGTLVEEGAEHLYGQVLVVDGGNALGRSKDSFLNEYFYPTDYLQYNWALKPDGMERLVKAIQPFTFTVDNSAYEKELPQLIMDYVSVDLPSDVRQYYDDMCKHMIIEVDGGATITAPNAAVMTGKLQQIASGFIYDEDKHATTMHEEKLRAVTKLCAGTTSVMIVYQYKWELAQLKQIFPMAGVLGDNVNGKGAEKIQDQWNAERLNVLLVHPKSAGHGLNLQFGGCHVLFFGPIWSKDQTDQVIGRLRRRGQPSQIVWATQILARRTVDDSVIVPRVVGKGDTADLFNRHLKSRGDV